MKKYKIHIGSFSFVHVLLDTASVRKVLTAFLFSSADTALWDRCLKRSITLETGPLLVLLPVELSEPARGLVVTVASGVPPAGPVSELDVEPLLLAVLRLPDDCDINEFCKHKVLPLVNTCKFLNQYYKIYYMSIRYLLFYSHT